MKTKEELISNYKKNKKQYKPVFLLAWSYFLSSKELYECDQLEVFDSMILKKVIKKDEEWNKKVLIPYNEDNVKKAFYIELYSILENLNDYSVSQVEIAFSDIIGWLYILENNAIKKVKNHSKENLKKYCELIKKQIFENYESTNS